MKQYLDLSEKILTKGVSKSSGRAGMPNTISLFGNMLRFNLQDGFPLLTSKKVSFKNILIELIWFLKGDTNIKFLVDNGCNIWNGDCYRWFKKHNPTHQMANIQKLDDESDDDYDLRCAKLFGNKCKEDSNFSIAYGELGNVYGAQWRKWKKNLDPTQILDNPRYKELLYKATYGDLNPEEQKKFGEIVGSFLSPTNIGYVDQIKDLIDGLRKNPYGRRHIVTAWNPIDVPSMALPPCHVLSHFVCRPATNEERLAWYRKNIGEDVDMTVHTIDSTAPPIVLDSILYQRSVDVGLGLGYNIASYALLTEILAKMCGLIAGEFVWVGGDTHFYEDHISAIKEQIKREPRNLPVLKMSYRIATLGDPMDILIDDFKIEGYNPHPPIKMNLSVGTA
jgi:thymidylate synthase